jgi:galactokinase/mevalonate kinase-like predicted kinase
VKKNIIITGVAGMIGSNLLKKVINNNNIVYGGKIMGAGGGGFLLILANIQNQFLIKKKLNKFRLLSFNI